MPARPARVRRRTVLKAMALPALTPLFTTACGKGSKGTVRIAVIWSGWELTAFRQVLKVFTENQRWDVSVLSMGEDIQAVLGSEVSKAAAPDVVMLSQPGLVAQYADRLVPVQQFAADLLDAYPPAWRRLAQPGGQDLGVWFKASHTSMVWYRKSTRSGGSSIPSVPATWEEWRRVNQALASDGVVPLSLGAAEGWVLNEWLSNALLSLDREYYQRLTAKAVSWDSALTRAALRSLGEMWTRPGEFPRGIGGALLTQFEDSVLDVFGRQDAAMVAEGDFSYPVITRYGAPGVERAWFRFPRMSPDAEQPILVGGDLAALLRPGSPGGRELIRWLADPAAARIWASQGGLVSVNLRDDSVYQRLGYITGDLDAVRDVREGMDGYIAFQLSAILGGSTGQGLWKIMQDFLAALGDLGFAPGDDAINGVVNGAVSALVAGARQ